MDAVFSGDVELATRLLKEHVENRAALVLDAMLAQHTATAPASSNARGGAKRTPRRGVAIG
jgi:hypothetical protein